MQGNTKKRLVLLFFLILVYVAMTRQGIAETVHYELTIAQEKVSIENKTAEGMTINGGIPGPILRFKEGDTARIQVHNRMSVTTSIHWHGLLVPPDMDGVPYISFPPIQPGSTFTYEFPIRQSGTYWYHSHSGLQEQRGVYGSIVIQPRHQNRHVDSDHVILLSDWTTENPDQVLRTLKRGSEWYAIEKGSGQSIIGATRVGRLSDYFIRELQRMPAMDIADVAYDYFLANGQPETVIDAAGKELTRLRIVNGSATTYFHIEFAGGPMTIVSADGLDVAPLEQQRFLIGVAETYDILVTVPQNGTFEWRATAHDGSGYASVWIGKGQRFPAPDVPKPDLYHSMDHGGHSPTFALTPDGAMGMPDNQVASGRFDRPGMTGMDMGMGHTMEPDRHSTPNGKGAPAADMPGHADHQPASTELPEAPTMPETHAMMKNKDIRPAAEVTSGDPHKTRNLHKDRYGKKFAQDFRPFASDVSANPDLAVDGMDSRRPWPPYARLRSLEPTAFDADKPVREIRLTLDGDMQRYLWFLNNKPLSESDIITIRAGEVVRFIMINRTMMHHPMHLHGHFFRLINGQGDHAPLKHTVDVAPMSTTVIEFAANEFGDWFFHCHLLYHMKSGMARVIHYDGYNPGPEVSAGRANLFGESWYFNAEADILSNMTEGFLSLSDTRNMFKADWEVGWQDVDKTEWEGIVTYDRYLNRFSSIFVGADLLGEDSKTEDTRGIFGFRYLLPLNFESVVWVDTDGGARIALEKEFALTPRLALIGEVQYDTHDLWEGKAGLSYVLTKNLSLLGQWHSEFGWGGGLRLFF